MHQGVSRCIKAYQGLQTKLVIIQNGKKGSSVLCFWLTDIAPFKKLQPRNNTSHAKRWIGEIRRSHNLPIPDID